MTARLFAQLSTDYMTPRYRLHVSVSRAFSQASHPDSLAPVGVCSPALGSRFMFSRGQRGPKADYVHLNLTYSKWILQSITLAVHLS